MASRINLPVGILSLLLLCSCAGGPLATIELDYDGRAVAETTPYEPFFSFIDNTNGRRVNPDLRYEKGRLLLSDLPPGQYGITIDVDANMQNPLRYPGDLFYQAVLSVDRCEKCDRSLFHYDLMRIIHLTSPGDNNGRVHIWGVNCGLEHAPVAAPAVLSWDPVADGADYRYTVFRMSLGPDRSWELTANGQTRETNITLALPPSRENEYYALQLTAFREGRPVGILVSEGLCHFLIGYQFTVSGGGHE